jgi:uncharacterized protein (TIGR04255 family)
MHNNGKKRGRKQATPAEAKYPHSPLVEVVFEMRFPGEPAVECHRDEFFGLIRKEFPNVWVPSVEPGQPVALQPYHFRAADETETVMIALNRFAYAARRYAGFEHFEPRALELAQRFCKHFGIEKLTRTGLRYINAIPFAREAGAIPWRRYFTIDLSLPATGAEDFLNAGLAFETRCETGAITTRIACAKSAEGGREVFVLDFDFAKTEGLTASKLETYMTESHEHTKKLFEGILSDDYKAVMRGEVVQ